MELNELMSFGHIVRSADGNVTDTDIPSSLYQNEVIYLYLDDDGQSLDDDFQDVADGWTPLRGFTGQHGYRGPVMHSSEYVGGGLEDHIREYPGYYVTVVVDGMYANEGHDDDEDLSIGWAILFRPLTTEGE